jgi:prevent-host-death family protein
MMFAIVLRTEAIAPAGPARRGREEELPRLVILVILVVMTTVVSAADAKAGLSDLLRRAEAGEEIILTRNGVAVAKLGPVQPRVGGFLRGEVVVHDQAWWAPDADLADQFGT